ncbi:MAG: molybdopterin dinucleotide binding domain-containing protein [Halobacteriota archaeon]|nr:molybdopterin dinucleotide binding domain-containing protein [Halobacteriota archaeon]
MRNIKAKLITGRVLEQGIFKEEKMSSGYFDAVSVCEMNKKDMDELHIKEGSKVKVKSEFGEVVVRVKRDDGNPSGIAFIPMGPFANAIVDPNTYGVGMPQYKGMDVEITPTNEKILSIEKMIKSYGGE